MLIKNNGKTTDKFLIKDGKTDYKIVVNENLDMFFLGSDIKFSAREELQLFLKEATGIKLEIIEESEADNSSHYIYVGETVAFSSVKDKDFESLNSEGFEIKTVKDNVYICGKTARGTLFGVYEFLKQTINYRYFGIDQINYDKKDSVKLIDFDFADMPDIEQRSLGFVETFKLERNPAYPIHNCRLRLARTLYTDWIYVAHDYFIILPKDKYYKEHPEWYSKPSGATLCLSNKEMRKEFVKNLKAIIAEHKGCEYMMLGQEDTFEFCSCPECSKITDKDNGNPSGLEMEFSNYVAREIKTWLKETDPTRKLTLVTFAYTATSQPPVYMGEDGKYHPLDNSYVCEDNLMVMVVPRGPLMSADFFTDERNARIKEALLGWQVISPEMQLWTYCCNYDHFMINFNNISKTKSHYTHYKDCSVKFLFDQGPTDVKTPCFDMLRQYVQSNLLWDTSLDTDKLVDEFIDGYYRDVAPLMKEYYHKIFDRWDYIEKNFGAQSYTGGGSTYYFRRDFWPKDLLDECNDLFRQMRGEIEKYNTIEGWENYATLRYRTAREWLSVRFLLLNLYGDYYGKELGIMIEQFRKDCEKYDVNPQSEGNVDFPIIKFD